MLSKRIENLEAALNDPQSQGELSIETRRELMRIVREDGGIVEMLRTAAMLEDTGQDPKSIAAHLRRDANSRIRQLITEQLGADIAAIVCEDK